jgi:HTH-type transcriptional regulator/antitoxin MqsA
LFYFPFTEIDKPMSNSPVDCPICGASGTLAAESYDGEIKHNGHILTVQGLERSRCFACNAGPVMTDQIRRNQVVIADAKRGIEGFLSGDEIRRVRERLGLSQSAAANVFGGGENAFSKYERGEVLQSFAMDRLLRVAVDVAGVMSQLASYSGESLPQRHLISNEAAGWQGKGTVIQRQVVPQRRIRSA